MSNPMEPFESQNVRDDDAQVLDSLFIETDTPPDLSRLQDPIIVKALKDPPVITRVFTGDLVINPTDGWAPQQILPADALRKYLFMRVESMAGTAVVTDGIRISDDLGSVRTAGRVLHGKTVQMDPHTGPVYVYPTGNGTNGAASDRVSISWWAVSE